jgi:hypothetical protein
MASFAGIKDCKKLYSKNNYHKIKEYKLISISESKTLCGFNILYTDKASNQTKEQFILSKKASHPVFNGSVAYTDVCEHSSPIDNEIQCSDEKNDFFLLITKHKKEKFQTYNL